MRGDAARGIDLDHWEVLALMTGTASVLLRAIDPQPEIVKVKGHRHFCWAGKMPDGSIVDAENDALHRFSDTCPFGKPGDALFGRECWTSFATGAEPFNAAAYSLTDEIDLGSEADRLRGRHLLAGDVYPDGGRLWRPASGMPEWASRIATSVLHVEAIDMKNLSPFTLAKCVPRLELPRERWCWRIGLGAIVIREPQSASATKMGEARYAPRTD